MIKLNEIENGKISLVNFAKLIAEILENQSNKLLPLKDAKILLHNTAGLRTLILGKRNFNVPNYYPMPIEKELEQSEFFFRRLVLHGIIAEGENGNYSLDNLGNLWNDFCLARKYEYFSVPTGWNGFGLATKAKDTLAKILLKILEEELVKKSSATRRIQLMLALSAVHASFNSSSPIYETTTALMKRFDPDNNYKFKWADEGINL